LLGDGFSAIAFAWITLGLTHSALALGVVLAFQAVPRALLTLIGGSLSDRLSARLLMIASSAARSVIMLAVGSAGFAGLLGMPLLCTAAAVFGAFDAFFQPARASILPTVLAGDLMEPANALLSVGSRAGSMIGPAIGGIVVAVSNANYAFLVDGACFAACALLVSRVRLLAAPAAVGTAGDSPAESVSSSGTLLGRIRAGLAYAFADSRIRAMLVLDTVITFCFAGPFTVGFASLARFRLDGGAAALGLLNGTLAGGAIIGALVGGTVRGRVRVGLLIAALAAWIAVGMALLGWTHQVTAAAAVAAAIGIGIGFQGVFGISWIQRNLDGAVLGRVVALDMVCGYAIAPVSLLICGTVAQRQPAALFFGTSVLLALTAAGTLISAGVRAMTTDTRPASEPARPAAAATAQPSPPPRRPRPVDATTR
jgi:MFS family permease